MGAITVFAGIKLLQEQANIPKRAEWKKLNSLAFFAVELLKECKTIAVYNNSIDLKKTKEADVKRRLLWEDDAMKKNFVVCNEGVVSRSIYGLAHCTIDNLRSDKQTVVELVCRIAGFLKKAGHTCSLDIHEHTGSSDGLTTVATFQLRPTKEELEHLRDVFGEPSTY